MTFFRSPGESLRRFRTGAGGAFLKTVLLWCLPALLVGLALRAALMVQMPRAFYHPDSYTVFETYSTLVREGDFHIQPKKTPLAPLLYSAVLAMQLPPLRAIALLQHALGLLAVPMVGLLVALSFARWRWFIIPITLLVAVDPALLWYEHLSLPESLYTLGVVAIALSGLLLYRFPQKATLIGFLVALFLTTTARPEAKLWCLFGLVLVVRMAWPDRRRLLWATGGMLLFTALCFLVNRTAQSGSLLYSNVAHLTPSSLRVAPGFVEANADYFADLRERWKVLPRRIPHERKELITRVRQYLKDRGEAGRSPTSQANDFSGRIANEVCLRNLSALPGLAVLKFREGLHEPTTEDFGTQWAHERQLSAFTKEDESGDGGIEDDSAGDIYTRLLFHREFNSHDELQAYLREAYTPFEPDWLTVYSDRFQEALLVWRLPDTLIPGAEEIPGMPILFLLAVLGLLAQGIREGRGLNYFLLWLGAVLFMAFVLSLTGSNKGRFRIVFEPFLFLYALALVDVLIAWGATGARKLRGAAAR